MKVNGSSVESNGSAVAVTSATVGLTGATVSVTGTTVGFTGPIVGLTGAAVCLTGLTAGLAGATSGDIIAAVTLDCDFAGDTERAAAGTAACAQAQVHAAGGKVQAFAGVPHSGHRGRPFRT